MKREVRDCDYTGEKDIKNPIELTFTVDKRMDPSGNGMEYIYEYLDISSRAAGIILNGLISELSHEQQKILYLAVKTKKVCHPIRGFSIIAK